MQSPSSRTAGSRSRQDFDGHIMPFPPVDSSSGAQVGLAPEVERLLVDIVEDGFILYCCRDRAEPSALIASYEWGQYVDVVTIRGFERVTVARVPQQGKVDVFAPEVAVWSYEGPAEPALRALLNLVHPQHPDAPATAYPAPRSLHPAPRATTVDDPASFGTQSRWPSRSARGRDDHGIEATPPDC